MTRDQAAQRLTAAKGLIQDVFDSSHGGEPGDQIFDDLETALERVGNATREIEDHA